MRKFTLIIHDMTSLTGDTDNKQCTLHIKLYKQCISITDWLNQLTPWSHA